MKRSCFPILVAAALCTAPAFAQTVISIPMDEQINVGMDGTADSPDGDAIYVPAWNTRDYLEFIDDADGYTRLWIQGNEPNAAGGYYYGPYIDFNLAGYGELDFRGAGATLEMDLRYHQDPLSNADPYNDAPIFARVYTYDVENDTYQGYLDYGMVYQTGPTNSCDPKPTGYPEWWHVTIDLDDLEADWNCDGGSDVVIGDDFDLSRVSRMRFWGTDWNAAVLDSANDWIDVKNVVLTLYPPPCDYDLTGDGAVGLEDLSMLLTYFGCTPALDTIYDTGGFEAYDLGDLPGQDGWLDDTTDSAYGMVQVVDDPTDSGRGQVIALDPPGTAGGWLGAERPFTPNEDGLVVIQWDQYRTDTFDNLWYADNLAFDGWWGMQWDQNGQASSYFFEFGVPITIEQWQHVTYIIDTVNGTATVDIDGETYSSAQPDTSIAGIVFEMEPTAHEGDNGPVYIDNLTVGQGEYYPSCPADLNGDGEVGLTDLSLLLSNYGCEPG